MKDHQQRVDQTTKELQPLGFEHEVMGPGVDGWTFVTWAGYVMVTIDGDGYELGLYRQDPVKEDVRFVAEVFENLEKLVDALRTISAVFSCMP